MKREQLEALSRITPGPWKWEDWSEDDGPNRNSLTADPQYRPTYDPKGPFPNLRHRLLCDEDMELDDNHKTAIAALPDLLAERERMIAALESARGVIGWAEDGARMVAVEHRDYARDKVTGAIQKLNAVLAEAKGNPQNSLDSHPSGV